MLFPPQDENVVYTSMSDSEDPFSTFAEIGFELDGEKWPTVEHYFQAMKFEDVQQREKVRTAATPQAARKLGSARFKRIRADWQNIQQVVMTRALYTKCKTYPDVAEKLLDTGNLRIVERSLYDYFWGCGRDGRGTNTYGKILMNIRQKLKEEQKQVN